jgi:hypothetical protein
VCFGCISTPSLVPVVCRMSSSAAGCFHSAFSGASASGQHQGPVGLSPCAPYGPMSIWPRAGPRAAPRGCIPMRHHALGFAPARAPATGACAGHWLLRVGVRCGTTHDAAHIMHHIHIRRTGKWRRGVVGVCIGEHADSPSGGVIGQILGNWAVDGVLSTYWAQAVAEHSERLATNCPKGRGGACSYRTYGPRNHPGAGLGMCANKITL